MPAVLGFAWHRSSEHPKRLNIYDAGRKVSILFGMIICAVETQIPKSRIAPLKAKARRLRNYAARLFDLLRRGEALVLNLARTAGVSISAIAVRANVRFSRW